MIHAPSDLADVLAGTALAGREVRTLEISGPGDVAFAVPCGGGEVLSAWTAARGVLERTGRYPVAGALWGAPDDLTGLLRRLGRPADRSEQEVLDRVVAVDLPAVTARRLTQWFIPPAGRDLVEFECQRTHQVTGISPTADDVVAALGADAELLELERWLLDWEVEHAEPGCAEEIRDMGRPESAWFEPLQVPCFIAFWPTPVMWQTAAYTGYWEAADVEEELCALLRSWQERYGAELVASWGTMLQLLVSRPPADLDNAWRLAGEQMAFGGSYQGTRRHLALALYYGNAWFLQERP